MQVVRALWAAVMVAATAVTMAASAADPPSVAPHIRSTALPAVIAPTVAATSHDALHRCRTVDGATVCIETVPLRRRDSAPPTLPTVEQLRSASGPAFGPVVPGAPTPGIACEGNGTDGHRVQALYLYTGQSRLRAVAPLIRRYAAQVDAVMRQSAAAHGGPGRRVRWAASSGCVLSVVPVKISAKARRDLGRMSDELREKGFNRTDRLYLGWLDHPARTICGEAEHALDTTAARTNASNLGPAFGVVYATCWGQSFESGAGGYESTEAHELMHMLGAVNEGAPNVNRSGHCRDEWDLMCYRAKGDKPLRYKCSRAWVNRFDCGGNDYFDPSPRKGSWLAKHWNTANSSFLIGSDAGPPVIGALQAAKASNPGFANLRWSVVEDQVIVRQEVEERVDVRPWVNASPSSPTRAYSAFSPRIARGHRYQWRVRAMDSAGTWSAWAVTPILVVARDPGISPR